MNERKQIEIRPEEVGSKLDITVVPHIEVKKRPDITVSRRLPNPVLVSEVDPIEKTIDAGVKEKKDLAKLIEIPLLSACEILYDKNIKTIYSTANKKNIAEGNAVICIDYDSLSADNKKVAREVSVIYQDAGTNIARISIPVGIDTTVNDLKMSAEEIANKFFKQSMTWVRGFTAKELLGEEPDNDFSPTDFEKDGYYYDKNEKLFYLSKEQWEKSHEKM